MKLLQNKSNLKKDVTLKDHFKNKEIFADLANAVLYDGKQVIKAENLCDYDSDMATVFNLNQPVTLNRNRDVIMKADFEGIYALIAIENQSYVDYTMPLRIATYDICAYNQQLKNFQNLKKKYDIPESFKLLPVYTVVLYYGENNWTAPNDLHGMMSKIPEELKKYINNWRNHVIDVKKKDWLFHEKDNQDLFNGLQKFYQWKGDINSLKDLQMSKKTAIILASLIGNDEIIEIVQENKGDDMTMFKSVELFEQKAIAKGIDQGIHQGISQGKLSMLMNQLKQRFGSLSKQTIINLETSSSEKLDELSLNIFNLANEEDINKVLLN